MNDLAKRTLASLLTLPLVLAALIFGPALSLNYWQGWLYWSVMLAAVFAIMAYCLTYTPALIERRRKSGPFAEREPRQKLIQAINSVAIVHNVRTRDTTREARMRRALLHETLNTIPTQPSP